MTKKSNEIREKGHFATSPSRLRWKKQSRSPNIHRQKQAIEKAGKAGEGKIEMLVRVTIVFHRFRLLWLGLSFTLYPRRLLSFERFKETNTRRFATRISFFAQCKQNTEINSNSSLACGKTSTLSWDYRITAPFATHYQFPQNTLLTYLAFFLRFWNSFFEKFNLSSYTLTKEQRNEILTILTRFCSQ